jgi:hypothetical protein
LTVLALITYAMFGLLALVLSLLGVGGVEAAIRHQREINPNLPLFGVIWRVFDGPALLFVMGGTFCTAGSLPFLAPLAYWLQVRRQRHDETTANAEPDMEKFDALDEAMRELGYKKEGRNRK